jgi:hypothetical protein
MDKSTARKADKLLKCISKMPKNSWHTSHIENAGKEMEIPLDEIPILISLFLHDGVLERIVHPGAPDHDFGIYHISHKGLQFIRFEGGYTKRRKQQRYRDENEKFAWYRHWLWFIGFVLSFLLNLYLLFFKNA